MQSLNSYFESGTVPKRKESVRDFMYSVSEPQSSAEYEQMQRDRKRQEALMEQSTKQTFELRRQFTEGTERNLSASDLPGIAADLRRIYGKKSMNQIELQERLEPAEGAELDPGHRRENHTGACESGGILCPGQPEGADHRERRLLQGRGRCLQPHHSGDAAKLHDHGAAADAPIGQRPDKNSGNV